MSLPLLLAQLCMMLSGHLVNLRVVVSSQLVKFLFVRQVCIFKGLEVLLFFFGLILFHLLDLFLEGGVLIDELLLVSAMLDCILMYLHARFSYLDLELIPLLLRVLQQFLVLFNIFLHVLNHLFIIRNLKTYHILFLESKDSGFQVLNLHIFFIQSLDKFFVQQDIFRLFLLHDVLGS
jgi:hypothetical protein